jgi:hypothetical protein
MRILLAALFFLSVPSFGQLFPPAVYPAGYFRNPLDVPMNLAGNFGELRPNHYHMGLDLKTLQRENLPVYAAADGYIARIKIEPQGFGRAIYINHPNGYTTLYAHLNNFNPKLEAWVKEQQYALQSWNIFSDLPPSLFPVKKGDLIAYSGNTGGSQAPHVHFEIRETANDINLNPFLFGFPIPDNTKPTILRLGVYDRTKSVYEQSPRVYPVKFQAGKGLVPVPSLITVTSAQISFAITSYDTHSGSSNLNGIFEAIMSVDGQPVSAFRMDHISYNDTRYLNAHIDYKTKKNGGPYLQHLSELPGYINSIYKGNGDNGVLYLNEGEIKQITIDAKDANGNTASLSFRVQYKPAGSRSAPVFPGKMFYPLMVDGYESPACEFFIGEKCLYDSVHVQYSQAAAPAGAISAIHTIGAAYIPLQEAFLVRIKPNRNLSHDERYHTVMVRSGGGIQKVEWQQEWAGAKFRDFGSFRLIVDTVPPVVVPSGFRDGSNLRAASRIVFTVNEDVGGVKNVRAELDGKWLRFTNDKGRSFIYIFDEKCPPGDHELKISAEDEAGNLTVQSFRFSR